MKRFILPVLFATTSLLAFDTRSHVWISQQVINDLEKDAKVTIAPFGEFDVDPSIVSAILENKSTYRMGNIGPDGFPDVVGGQVTVHPGLEDGYIDDDTESLVHGWKSDEWFAWVLSKAQTPQEKAFAYGFLGHGAADTFAHTYVNMYAGDIFDMNDGETDVEKRHIFLEKFISDRLPPMEDENGAYLGEPYQLVAVNDELPIGFIKSTLLMNETVAQQYALSGTASYLSMMYDFREKIAALDDDNTETTVNEDITEAKSECDSSWYPGKYILSIFKSKDEACEEENYLKQKLSKLSTLKSKYSLNTYSFKKAWLEQIDHAIDEYIKASSRMSQGFMNQDGDTYSQLTDWMTCYGTSFTDPTTLGSKTVEGSCNISNEVKSKLSFLDDVKSKVDFTLLSKLKGKVNGLSDSLGNEIISLIGVAALEIITVRDQAVSEDSLDEQFGMDESEKHLLLINDISTRVKLEMGLDMNGELNPDMYHVLYNAVVLSKLSLLSAEQINLLISRAQADSVYQYNLNTENFNILFNSIKTIDGNHQWMHKAPPYPRVSGFDDVMDHYYGYDANEDATKGFKLFETNTLRFDVFNKIFKGPLSLGLETPAVIHQPTILDASYPYVSCEANPFPDGVDDKRCEILIQPIDNNDTNITTPPTEEEESWWNTLISYLTDIVMNYFDTLVGQENIISTTETDTSVEVITTVPDDGIKF